MQRRYSRWTRDAVQVIRVLAWRPSEITADDLWPDLKEGPPHPNLIGAAFRMACGLGYITATETTVKSTRAATHARRVLVWRSRFLGAC